MKSSFLKHLFYLNYFFGIGMLIFCITIGISHAREKQPSDALRQQQERVEQVVTSVQDIYTKSIGNVTVEGNTLVDKLIDQQETKKMKRELILHYCDVVLHTEHAEGGNSLEIQYQNHMYDPKQSWFVYFLCVNVDETSKGRKIVGKNYVYRNYKKEFDAIKYQPGGVSFKMNDYLKEDIDIHVDIRDIPTQGDLDAKKAYHPCDPATSMQSCSFSNFLPDIFTRILNEYSNLKLGSLYGYQALDPKKVDGGLDVLSPDIKKVVAQYARTYFGGDRVDDTGKFIGDTQQPCLDPDITYLDPDDPNGKSAQCSHPKTYALVASTLKSAKRLIDKTVFLDGGKLLEKPCEGNERNYLLMKCAFATRGSESFDSDIKSFNNLIINELLWYNLFVTYYTQMLLYDTSYHALTMGSASYTQQRSIQEYTTMLYEKKLATQAIEQMTRMIYQTAVYFPLHVGLSAYYEDLVNYRKTITKSYTPFHQLSYKRRNVQSCDE